MMARWRARMWERPRARARANATTTTTTTMTPSSSNARRVVSVRAQAKTTKKAGSAGVSTTGASLVGWTPTSWRQREALQQPNYENQEELAAALTEIQNRPPLVFAGESRNLQERLAKAARGDAFVLFGGDCAESFKEFRADTVRDTYRVLLQMSVVLMYGSGVPVVKLGRMAGQFAKPRSEDLETIGGVSLPSYRGDNINSVEFTPEARRPDPARLIKAYDQSCATLNLLRAFSNGGYAAMTRVNDWNLDFMQSEPKGAAYQDLAQRVDAAIDFMAACGIDEAHPAMNQTSFFTAHEALHLGYEESLTRLDSTTQEYYGCSAHFLWCGERTRQPEGAHMEYFRGISNPIGIKISDKSDGEGVVSLVKTLNPDNIPGRITLISRMGAAKLREHLPRLITAIDDAKLNVLWVTDPMHGNTIKTDNGFKTRPFEAVRDEIMAFFEVHEKMGTVPGGVHLEMTGQDVTECTGGTVDISNSDLEKRYLTHCDPRLNASQAIELAFLMASELNAMRERRAAQ
mmetsp:Transcript_8155/g.30272  ORF Transcript_8155/g.30272 Transcript_8155/m.30272 type:complete len:517 (-) Transcript_8155:230-1780(-)